MLDASGNSAEGNPAKWLEAAKQCTYLPEEEMRQLCAMVKELLLEEGNIQPVSTPVTICGDIHGQFYDLLELFRIGGGIPDTSYLFMGDYVDRGYHSLETFTLLLALKANYPNKITLLRGNHESRQITQVYGFYDECMQKYQSAVVWKCCTEIFDYLPIAALVDGSIFCVHAGLSPSITTLEQIQTILRITEIPNEGGFADMMWSDPEDEIETWGQGARGAGYLFGGKIVDGFCRINNLDIICRSHQLVNEGYKYHFKEQKLVTVWSAPNYCYRCGNLASILQLDSEHTRTFKLFQPAPESSIEVPSQKPVAYFV